MAEKLTLKKLSGEMEALRTRLQEMELQLKRKLETTLGKAAAKLKSKIDPTRVPEHGLSIDAEARQQLIAEEAYLIAEKRHFQDGDAAEDWARAVEQVNHRLMQESIVEKTTKRTKRSVTQKASTNTTNRIK